MHVRTFNPRGATLIEGIAAAGILAVGILGAMQTLVAASQQNVIAARMARASQIASAVRSGLELYRWQGLSASGDLFSSGNCSTATGVLAMAGGLHNVVPPPDALAPLCVIDLDAWDAVRVPGTEMVPGYQLADTNPATETDGDLFRRILVVVHRPDLSTVTVVVSFQMGGTRMFVKQTAALYNPAANQAGVEL
jgi:hypothetical protein